MQEAKHGDSMEEWSGDAFRSIETENSRKWTEDWREFESILDTGVKILNREEDHGNNVALPRKRRVAGISYSTSGNSNHPNEAEGFQEQLKGFVKSTWELLEKLAQGCRDVVRQSLGGEDSVLVRRVGGMWAKFSPHMEVVNQFLPEDRNPAHVWSVLLFVFFLTVAVLRTGMEQQEPAIKEVYSLSITADRIQLPDGRYIAYREEGVSASLARHSILVIHSFVSSRLAGIPGIKQSLLEEFGVRLVAYDLPGFGESDPHPHRNFTSSALDMIHIADTLGLGEKFWVLGYSVGGIHAWAALRYIPERLAGAALFAPMGNPYDPDMTKDEVRKIWEKWTLKRKLGFILAKRASSFLPSFYKRSFGKAIDHPIKSLSFTLGKKDGALVEQDLFIDFLHKDMQESVRQGSPAPFVEETIMQVNKWGFSLADLQVRKKLMKGFTSWIHSLFNEVQEEWEGFLGPIHIWQGMDDRVVPYPFNDYAKRMVPGATLHKLIGEGHFSYFCFCDQCHREIFVTLFGIPKGTISETFVSESVENG